MARPRFTLVWPALVALTVAFTAAAAGKYRIGDNKKTSVTFTVGGPAGLGTIKGENNSLSLDDQGDKLVIKVPVAGFKTGIDGRDTHFRQKLEGADGKFTHVSLVVAKSDLKIPGSGKAKATFKVHGVEKEKTFSYTVKKGSAGFDVSGSFQVNVKDHGFGKDTFCFPKAPPLGLCTNDVVDVKASFQVADD
jgi:polyisoprenoid-binding protein YceI